MQFTAPFLPVALCLLQASLTRSFQSPILGLKEPRAYLNLDSDRGRGLEVRFLSVSQNVVECRRFMLDQEDAANILRTG